MRTTAKMSSRPTESARILMRTVIANASEDVPKRSRRQGAFGERPLISSSRWLSDDAAPHHADLVAGDIGRGVGGKEQAGVGDFLRPAQAAERDLLELLRRARRRLAKLRLSLRVAALGVPR